MYTPFAALVPQQPDALLGLIAQFRDDPRDGKIDLGVGVYRDDEGATPVMRAVKAAEQALLGAQATKSYLGPDGDGAYTDLLAELVFGEAIAQGARLAGVQTPGGTGALRIGAELIARMHPGAKVWVGAPTWPNHAPIFEEAGLAVAHHRFFDTKTASINFEGMLADLTDTRAGDVLLLHGCCHNPTGAGFTAAQWTRIATLCASRGLLPFIDMAYQGLADGLDIDAAPTRLMLEAVPNALVAYSCDKNFGLYRERVGAFWLWAANADATRTAQSNVLALARSLWSMPPDHGAAVVRVILQSEDLRALWTDELAGMRGRINALRAALGAALPALTPIARQRGLFAMLSLGRDQVAELRDAHGIYMADSGRINIAGLKPETIPMFARALAPLLDDRTPHDDF